MLKERLPTEIQNLIMATYSQRRPEPEIALILPPKPVQEAYLSEVGIIASLPEQVLEQARDWLATQTEVQTRAIQAQEKLQKVEPFSEEQAKLGQLPLWSVQKWAQTLHFEWSAELSTAVTEAEEYLTSL